MVDVGIVELEPLLNSLASISTPAAPLAVLHMGASTLVVHVVNYKCHQCVTARACFLRQFVRQITSAVYLS